MIATASIAHPAMYRGDGTLWRRVQKVLATFAILGLAASAVAVSSLAVFTDQAQVTGNTFSTGTVNIDATPATAVVTMPVMAPGDQVTAPLTVQNLGTLDLRYAMTSTTTEDVLAAALVMTIKTGVASCDNTGFASTGTQIYQGILGATTTSAILGSNVQGADSGDRTLPPAPATNSEVLCINVALPLASDDTTQGLSTTATFTFDAEQTINNP